MLLYQPDKPIKYRLSDFDYKLPAKLIAQEPAKRREQAKLMVLHRETGEIEHKKFPSIVNYIGPKDYAIFNDTKVFAARLFAMKEQGDARVELFLLRQLTENLWEALVKPARKVRIGNKLDIAPGFSCDVMDNTISGGRVVRFSFKQQNNIYDLIAKHGIAPLPSYIKREPVPSDKKRYQTVYAQNIGSVAAPTAGLHFTQPVLDKIKEKGTTLFQITLHIGLGTFREVAVEELHRHQMDSEYYHISYEIAQKINKLKAKGGKLLAVGTSTVRAVESAAMNMTMIAPRDAWTDKFIYPPYKYNLVDMMLTNFHQPKSTLLMMVAAFGGYDSVMKAYKVAIKEKYRFHSYGDAMLII